VDLAEEAKLLERAENGPAPGTSDLNRAEGLKLHLESGGGSRDLLESGGGGGPKAGEEGRVGSEGDNDHQERALVDADGKVLGASREEISVPVAQRGISRGLIT